MTASEVSRQSEKLLNWLAITGIKCGITEQGYFRELAKLVLLDSIEIAPTGQRLLKLGWRVVSTILWGLLILIILSSLGRYFVFANTPSSVSNSFGGSNSSIVTVGADKLSVEIDAALLAAREAALTTASDELDRWVNGLMLRVDSNQNDDFLDWYFGYWTQQKFGLNGALQAGKRVFNKNLPTAKEKIQEEVLQEFINRVLRPEIAKLELKNISKDISRIYTTELQRNFERIRIRYNIPKANWDEYLENVTVLVTNIEGRQVPLQLKAFTIVSLGGGALLAKAAIVAIEKVTAKVATKVVAKASASFLGKAGALVGGELLGPVVTVAIIAWDAVDIHNTEVNYRPILKENIQDYFDLMKKDILGDEENGIQKVIIDIENSIRKGMSGSRLPFFSKG
ncbi:MAG: hypothetical protein N5P05_001977 [Chroococcopsis gigantea SAG 12.99]|jgi:hypothetical protein|nr:hypothetical protein [Chlorogloea purpurea SAG 13.99]MDV3000371.1 hypothetical protein [Chroococcopsis gigantea SAG 12.99]